MTSIALPPVSRTRTARTAAAHKITMAVTGLLLITYLVSHVLANLLVYAGPRYINGYGRLLHATGPLLWVARAVLLAAAVLHVHSAVSLARAARTARGRPYARGGAPSAALATRTIRWGGAALFAFLLVHVPQFTAGVLHPSFVAGDDYHNVVRAFRSPWIVPVHLAAALVAGLHLFHGATAAPATLGVPTRAARAVRRTALVLALLIGLGFASIPIAVLLGALGE
jgi:succinate dehydrogenase / fumarate reductase cytochrome b subunit